MLQDTRLWFVYKTTFQGIPVLVGKGSLYHVVDGWAVLMMVTKEGECEYRTSSRVVKILD
jgi:hypothetical protein